MQHVNLEQLQNGNLALLIIILKQLIQNARGEPKANLKAKQVHVKP